MNILVFLILGFLTSLLFPPYFFLPIGFIIFPLFCYLFDHYSIKNSKLKIFLNSFSFSFTFLLSFLIWLKNPFLMFDETKYLILIILLLIILLSLIFCFSFLICTYYNKIVPTYIIIPIAFIFFEFLISILLYGFPWVTFALVTSSNEHLSFSVKYLGTLMTSYLIIQIFCLPYLFMSNIKKLDKFYKYSFLFLTPLILIILNNKVFKDEIKLNENLISVEIFQLNNQINLSKKDKSKKLEEIKTLISSSESKLLIFAENNYPYLINNNDLDDLQNILKKKQNVIIGGTRKENTNFYNTLFNITKSNIEYFDKKILVPFGEFIPFRSTLKFFEPISGTYDFSSGTNERKIKINESLNYIPIICYEIIFYWKLINQKNFNSNLIVNITNDIWFGKYIGPIQHFYLTKLRAAEYNKTIIRVSNNGISAIIDQNGKILTNTKFNTNENLKYKLNIKQDKNFFKTHFYLKIYFFVVCFFLFIANIRKIYE